MKQLRSGSGVFPLLIAAILLLLAGCDDFLLYDTFPLGDLEDAVAGPLTLQPASTAVEVNTSLDFTADGGIPGYIYRVETGGGSIDTMTGAYQAPSVPDTVTVRVTDAAGDYRIAFVSVVEPQQLMISPSTLSMNVDRQHVFSAAGGAPPYHFSASGGGVIDASTGLYTAPSGPAIVSVSVSDSIGTISGATVNVVSSGPLGVDPPDPEVEEGISLTFTGYGGTPPYSFSLQSGSLGSLNSATGEYIAPADAGSNLATVALTDSTLASVLSVVTVLPRSPADLMADGSYGSPQDIRITWTDRSAVEDGYRIERKTGTSGTFAPIASVSSNITAFIDTGLTPNTPYIYRVRAYKGILESPASNEAFDVSNS